MQDEFDKLEEDVIENMHKLYSDTFIDHSMNPRNADSISSEDGFAAVIGSCGDTMEIWIKVRHNRIERATFWTDGCSATIACGSIATEAIKDKEVIEALQLNSRQICDMLGGLPEESVHCAGLAATTVKKAILQYLESRNEPWKRAYKVVPR